jgi:aryl-alcohol dehydrogenase-like predicted oxidoreductase
MDRQADWYWFGLLANPAITAPIVGPRMREQLTGALRALEITLDEATMKPFDLIYPGSGGAAPVAHAW